MQYIKILRNSSPLPHVQILQKKKKKKKIDIFFFHSALQSVPIIGTWGEHLLPQFLEKVSKIVQNVFQRIFPALLKIKAFSSQIFQSCYGPGTAQKIL